MRACAEAINLGASCGQGPSAELGRINPSLLAPHFSTLALPFLELLDSFRISV
jgi:hypothetical protein